MLNNKYTNSQFGWKIVPKEDLLYKVSEETYKNMKQSYYPIIEISKSNLIKNSKIGANGERYVTICLSKSLSAMTDNSNTDFSNSVEILNYTNDLGIRMKKSKELYGNNIIDFAEISGNSLEGDNKENNGILLTESDYAKSMRIVILPPTGKEVNTILGIIITSECILILLFRRFRLATNKK